MGDDHRVDSVGRDAGGVQHGRQAAAVEHLAGSEAAVDEDHLAGGVDEVAAHRYHRLARPEGGLHLARHRVFGKTLEVAEPARQRAVEDGGDDDVADPVAVEARGLPGRGALHGMAPPSGQTTL